MCQCLTEKYSCEFCNPIPADYLRLARALAQLARQHRETHQLLAEGRRLKAARLAAGLSTGQAAKRLGVSRARLWRWESGEKWAPAWAWERLGRGSACTWG